MNQREWRITRQELYQALWEKPLKVLEEEYNVWYGELLRISDKYQIPRPPMGYWTKKQHGKPTKQTPLEPLEGKEEIVVQLYVHEPNPVDPEQKSEADRLLAAEALTENLVQVGPELVNPHPLVELTQKRLQHAKPNEKHVLVSEAKKLLDIRVTQASLDRALRIMDALLKGSEKRGFVVEIFQDPRRYTMVKVLGVEFAVTLEEVVERKLVEPTPEVRKKLKQDPTYWYHKEYTYHPTGCLSLKLRDSPAEGARKTINDGKRHLLEDRLNKFIISMIQGAVSVRSREIQRAEQHRKWEEESRRQEQLRQEQELERKFAVALVAFSDDWDRCKKLRSFIEYVREAYAGQPGVLCMGFQIEEWLEKATKVADGFDPISEVPRPNLEEKKGWW